MLSQEISAGAAIVPFSVPGLAVLGVDHEDVVMSTDVLSKWQQNQHQLLHGKKALVTCRATSSTFAPASSFPAVFSPRSCPLPSPKNLKPPKSSEFLALCESHVESHVT
jgi:hypothetical protein